MDGPLPGKNDNMAAMTLAVGAVYREIYSWKVAIVYMQAFRLPRHTFVHSSGEDWKKVRERVFILLYSAVCKSPRSFSYHL